MNILLVGFITFLYVGFIPNISCDESKVSFVQEERKARALNSWPSIKH